MNGRAPEYVRCKEQTLVKRENGIVHFVSFWKNVHQQRIVSKGTINGCTYTVNNSVVVTKDEGNRIYIDYRKDGYVKFKDSDFASMIDYLGEVLY